MRFFLALLITLGLAAHAMAAEATPVPTPREAVGWALADIVGVNDKGEPNVPLEARPFIRYVWIPPWGTPKWIAATNFAFNTAASHSTVIQLGTPIANGWMLRYDLRRLAPKAEQLAKLITTYDSLSVDDPYFHVPQTNSKLAVAILAPHLEQPEAVALTALAGNGAAIYRADWLIYKMLSTLEGGRYYDFLQIERKPEKNSAQVAWLATLGVFEGETQKLQADQRTALVRSGVTGKPRRIDVFYGLGRGGNLVSITHDINDEDNQAERHPVRNLLNFQDRAREVIVERPNGLHAFALFNAQGDLQDSVPDNIARDSTIPSPHTGRLQPAISCIRCHGGNDGWQPLANDIQTLLASGLDVFSDLADVKNTREQIIDRLVGLYAGELDNPDGPLGRARRNYQIAVFRITGGPRLGDPQPAASVVGEISATLGEMYRVYRYDVVTPARAALELGMQDGTLDATIGPRAIGVLGDPLAGLLRANVSINRNDFEIIYGDLATIAEGKRKKLQK